MLVLVFARCLLLAILLLLLLDLRPLRNLLLFARSLLLIRTVLLWVIRLLFPIRLILLFARRLLLASLLVPFVLGPHHGSMVLWLGMIRPVLMLANPVWMVGGNPTRILIVPPLAIMPVALGVVGAILIAPIRLP